MCTVKLTSVEVEFRSGTTSKALGTRQHTRGRWNNAQFNTVRRNTYIKTRIPPRLKMLVFLLKLSESQKVRHMRKYDRIFTIVGSVHA